MDKLIDEIIDLKLSEFKWPWKGKGPSSDIDREIESWSTKIETWKKVVVKLWEDSYEASEPTYRAGVMICDAIKDKVKNEKCYNDLFISTSKVIISFLKKNIKMCNNIAGEEYQRKCFDYGNALIKKREEELGELIKRNQEEK